MPYNSSDVEGDVIIKGDVSDKIVEALPDIFYNEEDNIPPYDDKEVISGYFGYEEEARPGDFAVLRDEYDAYEYGIASDIEAAKNLAEVIVKNDLEEEPDLFNKDFLLNYVNKAALFNDLYIDLYQQTLDDIEDMSLEEKADFLGKDEEDIEDMSDEEIDKLVSDYVHDLLSDPFAYLKDTLGEKEAIKFVTKENAYIDVEAAARDAVMVDGIGHFLSPYNGEIIVLNEAGGVVYWRLN